MLAAVKRRRFAMDAQFATENLTAAKQNYGREIRVFETSTPTPTPTPTISQTSKHTDESDDLDFTTQDYYRILSTKKEDKFLKTKKIRDAELAASRSRITKAVVRVRFPDNHTLEATFHPSEKMQDLVNLLVKVVARPDLPFYLYTTPPKKQIKDMYQDFYSAGFVPGAIVYFSYDLPKGDDTPQGPYLKEDVLSLNGLEMIPSQKPEADQPASKPVLAADVAPPRKPAGEKKMVKPKWMKM